MRNGPIGHGGDGLEGLDEGAIGVGAAVLPAAEGGGEELATAAAVGLGDDGREASVGEEGIGGPTDTVGVVVAGLVGEGAPLGGLVDGVGFEDEAALRAHRVAGGVVEHHLRLPLAVAAEGFRHFSLALTL